MPVVEANGLSLHYQELGAGAPLFLVHGLLLDNLASWYFGAAPALARRHRVVAYDLRAHGRSAAADSGFDSSTQAGDLAALADALAPGAPLRLAGASYGGLIALRFALARPERVERLALVDAPLPPRRYEELDALRSASPDALLAALPPALRREVVRRPRRALRLARAVGRLVESTSLLADVRGEAAIPDAELAALRPPLAAFYGAASPFLVDGERLAERVPGTRFATFAGGHRLLAERPAEIARALAEFFDA